RRSPATVNPRPQRHSPVPATADQPPSLPSGSAAGANASSRSPISSGSSSSRNVGSSDGVGTLKPEGSRESSKPVPLSSSSPGRSPSASRLNCDKKASVVP